MAEDMLGRAARALMERKIPAYKDDAIWAEDRASILMRLARDQDGFAEARTALLAVLDPEDEALVESIARSISWCGRDWDTPFDFDSAPDYAKDMQRDIARAAILTIKHAAQGEHGG